MLEVVNLTHGEICNQHCGTETNSSLTLPVIGMARSEDNVTVNGIVAERTGESFHAQLPLTHHVNTIDVHAEGNRCTANRSIKVIWDKHSFKRVNFCIDDHIYTFHEIASQRPKSIFDHFYLKKLQELHRKTISTAWN